MIRESHRDFLLLGTGELDIGFDEGEVVSGVQRTPHSNSTLYKLINESEPDSHSPLPPFKYYRHLHAHCAA